MDDRPRIVLIASVAAGVVTPSDGQLVASGFDLGSSQAVVVFGNYDSGTVTARLQGSNDNALPTNWNDIQNAIGVPVSADGPYMIGAGAPVPTQALLIGLFKWVRLHLTITGGAATTGQVSASCVSAGTVGSGQAGT